MQLVLLRNFRAAGCCGHSVDTRFVCRGEGCAVGRETCEEAGAYAEDGEEEKALAFLATIQPTQCQGGRALRWLTRVGAVL